MEKKCLLHCGYRRLPQALSRSLRPSLGCMCGSGLLLLLSACLEWQVSQSVWQWLRSCGSLYGCDMRVCVTRSPSLVLEENERRLVLC